LVRSKFLLILTVLLFFIYTVSAMSEGLSLECQTPENWKEIDLDKEKIDTDISPDIVIKAFEPSENSLLLVTAYFLEEQFTPAEWLNAMTDAFSGDKNIKIIERKVEKLGANNVVSLALLGKGKLYRFDKNGDMNIIRQTFLIPHGTAIIQFILICPESQYNQLKPVVSNVVGTLIFKYKV